MADGVVTRKRPGLPLEWDEDLISSPPSCLVICLPNNLSVMERLYGVGVL